MTTPIVTLEEVKAWLPVRLGYTDLDDKIEMLILLASVQIEQAISRKLTKQVYSVQYPTIDTVQVFIDFLSPTNERGTYRDARRQKIALEGINIDMNEAFTVWYDPELLWTDDRLVAPQANQNWLDGYGSYILDEDRCVLDLQIESRITPNGLRVDYTAGYAVDTDTNTLTTNAPTDIKMACILQVVSLYNRSLPDNVGVDTDRSQGKVPAGKFITKHGLTPEAAAMIAPYKRLGMGRF